MHDILYSRTACINPIMIISNLYEQKRLSTQSSIHELVSIYDVSHLLYSFGYLFVIIIWKYCQESLQSSIGDPKLWLMWKSTCFYLRKYQIRYFSIPPTKYGKYRNHYFFIILLNKRTHCDLCSDLSAARRQVSVHLKVPFLPSKTILHSYNTGTVK